jgi:hypothetical protein
MNTNTNDITTKESGYDQKQFLQIRLHELLSSIDKLNTFPAGVYYPDVSYFNCELVFQRLISVFQTIYSKLNEKEKEKGKALRKRIQVAIKRFEGEDENGKKYISLNNIPRIEEELFDFRCLLEDNMDKHGFNPSKDDVSKSILRF